MTKANKSHYEAYLRSSATSLTDVYGKCSSAKVKAWDYCRDLMVKKNGYDLRIISANGYMFTAGFMFEEDGHLMFMYITKSKDLAIEVKQV